MSAPPRSLVARVLLSLALAHAGCGPSAEQRERDRLVSAIAELRASPASDHAERRRLVQRLREQTTETPLGSRARDACARAYDLLTEANELELALRRELAGDPKVDPLGLAARFRRAEEALEQSRGEMELCDQASTELRLRR